MGKCNEGMKKLLKVVVNYRDYESGAPTIAQTVKILRRDIFLISHYLLQSRSLLTVKM